MQTHALRSATGIRPQEMTRSARARSAAARMLAAAAALKIRGEI